MAGISSKDKLKAGCQALYNSHDVHLVALSQRPPKIPYILLGCEEMGAVFLLPHSPAGRVLTR